MPKRVLDFDALWASDKLASCAEWAQSEYAWLYGLADASGSFEMTNLRVIWGRVAAIRKNLTLQRLGEIFDEFIARGLLFTWEENGKRYGHWTGSDVPGRLPAPSWRIRLEKLAPPVPRDGLAAYSARFGGSKEGIVTRAHHPSARESSTKCERLSRSRDAHRRGGPRIVGATTSSPPAQVAEAEAGGLKHDLEDTQAQGWDWDLEKDLEKEVSSPAKVSSAIAERSSGVHAEPPEVTETECAPQELVEIYEQERGALPPAGAMTPERRRRCERWLAAGFTPEEFRAAARCAAATPFLAGNGDRGWQASFDWLIANRSNVRKVLAGAYAPHPSELAPDSGKIRASRGEQKGSSRSERLGIADLYTGIGPRPADCGVRVNPAALERILGRQAKLLAQQRVPDLPPSRDAGEPPKPIACDAQARASPIALKS
jgi:hypothetical protein